MTAPDIFLSYNREDQAVTKLFADVRYPQHPCYSGIFATSPIAAEFR